MRLLTVYEVAGLLRLHPQTVWRFVRQGEIPVVALGRRRLFRPSDIEEFIASRVIAEGEGAA